MVTVAQKPADVLLTVGGELEHPLKLTRGDLDKFARVTVRAKDHDGKEYNFETRSSVPSGILTVMLMLLLMMPFGH